MIVREIREGHEIMEINRLANIIWHEAYRSILSREQICYMVEKFQSVRALTEQIAWEGYRYFLAEDETGAVGFCGVRTTGDRMYLSKAYLLASARGKGYFSAMIARLRALARETGVRVIWLTVNRCNAAAIGVYGHLGFETVRTQVTDIGRGYVMDDYVMELTLDGAGKDESDGKRK